MNILLIFGAISVLYVLLEQGQRNAAGSSASGGGSSSGGILSSILGRNNQSAALTFQSSAASINRTGGVSSLQLGQTVAGSGVAVASSLEGAAGLGLGTALGAATFGVGLAIAPIFMLLAAHTARIKGAKNENAGVNAIIPAIDADLKTIAATYRSGQVDGNTAIGALNQVKENYYQFMAKFAGMPGVASKPCPPITSVKQVGVLSGAWYGVSSFDSAKDCGRSCTAGCCIACYLLEPAIAGAVYCVQNRQKKSFVNVIFANKYGAAARPAYTLQWS